MLTLRRIEIENFVCFDSLILEPSTEPRRPLTVIRAENGNGKTTLLRAIRWGMYGEKGLPGISARYSLHPPWWLPEDAGVKTRVSIEFETDGSSRNHTEQGTKRFLYRLDRTVTTIGKPSVGDDAPDFYRVDEAPMLMVRYRNGTWGDHESHPDVVIEELLPWELRDFFIMDADEATDFVGGSDENKTVSRHEYREKTTHAINGLLGLEVFSSAKVRVDQIAKGFSRQASRAIGDQNLHEMQEQHDRAETEKGVLEEALRNARDRDEDLTDELEVLQSNLEREIIRLGAHEALAQRGRHNRQEQLREGHFADKLLASLAGSLESPHLLAGLSSTIATKVCALLKPSYDEGRIPLTHLPFVRSLLDTGQCVCGQDLSAGRPRDRVAERVSDTEKEAERADYLYHLYQAALSLNGLVTTSTWSETRTSFAADLAASHQRLADLKTEEKDIAQKLSDIDEAKIQTARHEIAAITKQRDNNQYQIATAENRLTTLNTRITSLTKMIIQRQRNELAANDLRRAADLSYLVVETLSQAYDTIRTKQVGDLSNKMNQLFHQIAANVSAHDFVVDQRSRANLRMIVEVGVKPVEDRSGSYEIYALNSRGRAMPPVEINGASRRVLALSFVLALCSESNTRAPLIADSLLNFMSGTVRRNTLRVTSKYSRQPILLLTNSDLEATSEIQTVTEFAGATYTLTAQWDAIGTGGGGDVVRRLEERQVTLVCTCGPREYCNTCERTGQASTPGWVRN